MESSNGVLKHKKYDSVFTKLFSDKKYLCLLFKVFHSDIDISESDIENVTLNCVLSDGVYNDLGFTAKGKMLILVEAQSTWSANIVTRLFFYAAETYKKVIIDKNLYGSKIIPLPKSEFFVVYTGDKAVPKTLSLAKDVFCCDDSALDLKVNILTSSKSGDILDQYFLYTKVLKGQLMIYGNTVKALTEAIKICVDKNILSDFLSAHKMEVVTMADFLFDQETVTRNYGKDMYQQGVSQGVLQQKEQDNIIIAQRDDYIKQLEERLKSYE